MFLQSYIMLLYYTNSYNNLNNNNSNNNLSNNGYLNNCSNYEIIYLFVVKIN